MPSTKHLIRKLWYNGLSSFCVVCKELLDAHKTIIHCVTNSKFLLGKSQVKNSKYALTLKILHTATMHIGQWKKYVN